MGGGFVDHFRYWLGALTAAVCMVWLPPMANAQNDESEFASRTQRGGANIGVQLERAHQAATGGERPGVEYEYVQVSFCASGPDDRLVDFYCEAAIRACANNTEEQGLGPATRVFRREVGPPPGSWVSRGVTCFPDLVGEDAGPQLTMAMIIEAFHDTPFAKPVVSSQPEGNTTLVTLPTYYRVEFGDGFGPDEVDTTDLLGFSVDIRPRLDSITYHYGDGNELGPTTDLGGVYPTGTVVHEYDRKGEFDAHAVVSYGGQFRVDGGDWSDIPGTATITGDPTTITVMESRARLVTGD